MKSRINKLEYKLEVKYNNKSYYRNNKTHRDGDIPALIWKSGSRIWYKNGLEHRDNGNPSSIFLDGRLYWFENGKHLNDNLDEIKN